jgi:hypothetical protein
LAVDEVRAQLVETTDSYEKWGFDLNTTPEGEAIFNHIFTFEPIEWNRECHSNPLSQRHPTKNKLWSTTMTACDL